MITTWIRTRIQKARAAAPDERGATIVEFALVAPFFLMFVIGIIDFGRLFWIKNTMQYAVEQTARYAMVNPTLTNSELETYADTLVEDLFTDITFDVSNETVDGVEFRDVTASYTFSYMIPLVDLGDLPLSSRSRTPVNANCEDGEDEGEICPDSDEEE